MYEVMYVMLFGLRRFSLQFTCYIENYYECVMHLQPVHTQCYESEIRIHVN